MQNSKLKGLAKAIVIVTLLAGAAGAPTLAQVGSWGYTGQIGILSGTVDNTAFAVGLTSEYYVAPAFSVGGDFLLSPTGDLTLLSGAVTARWHFDMAPVEITPFIGVGLIYADYERGSGPGRFNSDDVGTILPLGLQVDRRFNPSLSIGGSFALNLTSLDFGGPVGEDKSFTSFMLTLRYRP
ncbi:MAG: outer membrane beta-barrel protein [Acidobacteriota bacterium]|nr:outer membrane beta-barrel protein [Acidobacteriota bacterium]